VLTVDPENSQIISIIVNHQMMFNHYPTEMETNELLSNFMEQNPLSEADSHSGSQKISRIL
jgi:hypothetical protein